MITYLAGRLNNIAHNSAGSGFSPRPSTMNEDLATKTTLYFNGIVHSINSVSYTHLTLPTNREV